MRVVLVLLNFWVQASHAADVVEAVTLDQASLELKEREARQESLEVYQHNLNYFITGDPDTKVQLSFKVRLGHNFDLYAAYTQTMFWELFIADSSPFSDLNFNPELFYRWYLKWGILKGFDLGYEHKSNGRSGLDSRSWNRTYATARTEFSVSKMKFGWNTKVFYLHDLDETNRDIRYKMGFFETTFSILDIVPKLLSDAEIYLTVIPGGTWNIEDLQGSQQLGFRFRLPVKNFDPFIYVQIYNGMNESQLFYNENRTTYRIGFAI